MTDTDASLDDRGSGVLQPSEYELAAWREIQRFKGRPLSRAAGKVTTSILEGMTSAGRRASKFLEEHPRAEAAVTRGRAAAAKGTRSVREGVRRTVEALPTEVTDWSSEAFDATRRTIGRVSRVGLSPKRVVARHKKSGHDVARLHDLQRLDLEQIDEVKGRGASLYYPALAAASGAGAGFLISGGELVVTVSAGASAAPSGGVIAGAFIGDAAIVLGLSSRCVGDIALLYGYDPESPAEKLFVMSVVNAGSAVSAAAKSAGLADVSRLTQALVRGKTWAVLDNSVISQVSKKFASVFSTRLTKQGLGKVVPVAGIVIGSTF